MNGNKAEKTKKILFNRKIMLGVSAIVVCMFLIGICSFVPFVIDPTRWQTKEFLTDELITVAIVLSSMVGAIFVGQASNGQDEKSSLAKSRVKFFETVAPILEDINRFSQCVKKVLQPEDLKSMRERKLRSLGVEDATILALDKHEILALIDTPQKYNGRFYKSINKRQAKEILKIKEIKIEMVEPDYYLSVKNIIDNRTISERSANESVKKGLFLTRSIVGKVLITIVTSIIFASLMKDLTGEVDQAEAWAKFISRLWSMMSSIFMGYIVGCQINDIDAEYVEMRSEVHRKYSQDKTFVALSQQEIAKQEFIERVKKEQKTQVSQFEDYKNPNPMVTVEKEVK